MDQESARELAKKSNSVMFRAQKFTVWGLRLGQKVYGGGFQK